MGISNPLLNMRIRCDLAGITSLSDNWKGWEVFRFMEADHGYIKISSWMHSQWLLCSDCTGKVTTCSHSDSLIIENNINNNTLCSKWAIEKYIHNTNNDDDDNNNKDHKMGVIIRSKMHGRLLSVKDGILR